MREEIKRLSLLLATFVAMIVVAVGCDSDDAGFDKSDELTPGEIIDPTSVGYLSLSGVELEVSLESELHSDDESGDYDAVSTVVATRSVNTNDYIIQITNSSDEVVYKDSYENVKLLTEAMELPADYYTITAMSDESIPSVSVSPSYASAGGEADTYAVGDEKSVEVTSALICKMINIRTSVSMAADMLSLFKPSDEIDTSEGDVPLTVTLTYGTAEISFVDDEIGSESRYFASNSEVSTIHVELVGMYNTSAAGATPVYKEISWSENITGVYAGQAREVSIKINNYSEGKLLCLFEVESWVEDTPLGVDVQSTTAMMYSMIEEEIPDADLSASDEFSPEVTLTMGGVEYDTSETFEFGASIFDYDLKIYSNPIVGYVTPYDGTAVKSVKMTITSSNESFMSRLEKDGYSNGEVSLWSDDAANSALSSLMTIRQEDSGAIKVSVLYEGMLMFEEYKGEHTFIITATGDNNKRSYTTLNVTVISEAGPTIVWRDGTDGTVYSFDERYHVYSDSDVESYGYVNPEVVIDVTSESGLTALNVEITGMALTEAVLAALKLEQSMDLINPATDEMATQLVTFGFPVGEELLGETELVFDITVFMPALAILPASGVSAGDDVETQFIITASDSSGTQTREIKVYHTQP